MLNNNLKKSLLAAAVLTALCANAAFAADSSDKQSVPSMRERVASFLGPNKDKETPQPRYHDRQDKERKDCRAPRDCAGEDYRCHAPRHQRREMTPEQKAEHEKRRAAWEKMSPEERQQFIEKERAERSAAFAKRQQENLAKLTPEQKAEVEKFIKEDRQQRNEWRAQRKAMRQRLEKMTKEQRDCVRDARFADENARGHRGHRGPNYGGPRHGGYHHGERPADSAQ